MPTPSGLAPGGAPGPVQEKPSLVKELPIASYIITPITAGAGAAMTVFGNNAVKDLKDPSKHTTPSATHTLVVKARVGQVMSYVMFPVTGITTLWGTISTIRGVMKVSKMVNDMKDKVPPTTAPTATVSVCPLPGGMGTFVQGSF
jgi:hypothetical protein